MQKAEERISIILQKQIAAGISVDSFPELDVVKKLSENIFFNFKNIKFKVAVLLVLLSVLFVKEINLFGDKQCLVDMPQDASKIFREPENCALCEDVDSVEKIKNISSVDFYWNYAKPSKPVVVTDGAISWLALKYFNFDFFKDLYESVEIDKSNKRNCQFFPYKTEFKSLEDVFNMKSERAKLKIGEKPWYVGWSNCNDDAGKILMKYYDKPYFLANNSENIALSWIFMGGPGYGAHMHVDNVHYPSWQAQLSGKKLWRLAPPPECLYKCKEIEVTVELGEIIVVDTNRWYHQTFVLPGEISITIGSEFD